jgi:hypothetical protein
MKPFVITLKHTNLSIKQVLMVFKNGLGLVGIAKIEGSYTNVVGLPVDKVYQKLIHYAEIH